MAEIMSQIRTERCTGKVTNCDKFNNVSLHRLSALDFISVWYFDLNEWMNEWMNDVYSLAILKIVKYRNFIGTLGFRWIIWKRFLGIRFWNEGCYRRSKTTKSKHRKVGGYSTSQRHCSRKHFGCFSRIQKGVIGYFCNDCLYGQYQANRSGLS